MRNCAQQQVLMATMVDSHHDRPAVGDLDGDRIQDLLVFPGHETWGTTILLGTGQGGSVRAATEAFTPEIFGSQNVLSTARATTTRGSFEQRGTSGAGSGGFAMAFGALGPRRIDQFLELRVRDALGGAFAVVVLGPSAGDLRDVFGPGHHFYLDPTAPLITVAVVLAGAPGVAGQGTLACWSTSRRHSSASSCTTSSASSTTTGCA